MTSHARKHVILRSRRFSAGPKDLNHTYLQNENANALNAPGKMAFLASVTVCLPRFAPRL